MRSSQILNPMKTQIKKLRLTDAVWYQSGAFSLRVVHAVFTVAVSLFFRRIELYNSESLPPKSGLILVLNHPNALIDPALVFVAMPRRVAFLAKSTLFKIPVFAQLIRTVGALPLYRQQDAGADVSKNQKTFEIARKLLKKSGAIAIFPEGVSHNETQLQPLKTGAARIALGTISIGENPSSLDLKIVPVGLFYTNKTTFRSEALLSFGQPIDVAPVALDENGQPPPIDVKALTQKIEKGLREVTINAESEAELKIARVAEDVYTSVTPHEENLAERLEILQKYLAEPNAAANAKLEKQLAAYDQNLGKLGIESEFLALADYSKRFVLKHALRRLWLLVLLAPFALFGAVLHFPAYQICKFLAYLQTKKGDFDMASTMKILAGIILMPLSWIIFAAVLEVYVNWKIAVLSIPFSFVCGYIALRTLEETADLSGWLKAISVFFTKREKFLRLVAERKSLFEKLGRNV